MSSPCCHMARRISVLQMLEIRPPRYIFRERHVTVIWMKKVSVGQTFSEETSLVPIIDTNDRFSKILSFEKSERKEEEQMGVD